jgi:Cu(I)/Ag(I) efflux system membrane fusion protein
VLLSAPQPGQRIDAGKELCVYTDLSTIFVLADIRSSDIAFVQNGVEAHAILPAYPGTIWRGTVVDATPQFDERAQTLKVRLQFPNNEPNIWSGMLADVELSSHPHRALAIPESAVISDGESTVVFVEQDPGVFQPRAIETGIRAQSQVEVKQGLSAGDRVASAATFLLDSESRLRALARAGANR